MNDNTGKLDRRDMLKGTVAGLTAAALTSSLADTPPAKRSDLIRAENDKPGTKDWMLTKTQVDPKTKYRSPWIEGYVSHTSIKAGETLTLHVSTNPAERFTVDFYRLGYYQGTGGRHLTSLGPLPGITQPDAPIGDKRLRDNDWEPATSFTIPADWTTGVYLGKLTTTESRFQSYVVFIVKDDRPVDFLFQCSDNTWNAYNRWPNQFALYDNGEKQWWWGPGVATSYNRPYGKYCQIFDAPLSTGSGEFLLWEFPLAYWMEKEGYDLSYISNIDTHQDGASLARGNTFLSVGHDEYWSRQMFDNVKGLVDAGKNVAFFSGNTCYGLVDIRPDGKGNPDRVIERVGVFGPIDPGTIEDYPEMAGLRAGPNEAELLGARSTFPVTGGADWICRNDKHWLFSNTGMKTGDGIPGLVGWEWHGAPASIPGLEVVASGKTTSPAGEGTYTATLYPGPKQNLVFNASTIWWGDGLSEPPGYVRPNVYTTPKGPDPRVAQITTNLFREMLRRV